MIINEDLSQSTRDESAIEEEAERESALTMGSQVETEFSTIVEEIGVEMSIKIELDFLVEAETCEVEANDIPSFHFKIRLLL